MAELKQLMTSFPTYPIGNSSKLCTLVDKSKYRVEETEHAWIITEIKEDSL